jgi:hypothetical protein
VRSGVSLHPATIDPIPIPAPIATTVVASTLISLTNRGAQGP